MFQFHQNNSQLLFHIIVSLWGAGAFSRDFTTNLARRCRAFTRALKNEKLKAPPFPGPGEPGIQMTGALSAWFGTIQYRRHNMHFTIQYGVKRYGTDALVR